MKIKKKNFIYNESIFSEIYKLNAWGGEKGEFYSGSGSHNKYVESYGAIIADFILVNDLETIVEIGCGDFNVTKHILIKLDEHNHKYSYHGYDVVKELIARNNAKYGSDRIKFSFKDSCIGKIVPGQLLIIRQVLQHLDNKSVKKIVDKFDYYNFVIVTDHQPSQKYGELITPNVDKKTNGQIRVQNLSGIYLDHEPFNCKIDSLLFTIDEPVFNVEANINTFLLKSNSPKS